MGLKESVLRDKDTEPPSFLLDPESFFLWVGFPDKI